MKIGVIGAGQLARMMIPPAVELGLQLRVLAEGAGMSAQLAATATGNYRDIETVLRFAETVDIITFDHEHVPQEVLQRLIAEGVTVAPGPQALQFAQNKLRMRERLGECGLPMPKWAHVTDLTEVESFLANNNGRAVLKTPFGGYDGKGVLVIESAEEARAWLEGEQYRESGLLIEEAVGFRRELAQLLARSRTGEIRCWPLVETVQRRGVCASVLAPAPGATAYQAERAREIACKIAEDLDVVGVLAIELFERSASEGVEGELLVNELAMRPHNSGHFTIEGSLTSQFEQHLRAVAGLPLGATEMREKAAVMVNVLGGGSTPMHKRYRQILGSFPSVKVHNYGKEPRPGRKIGHVTAVGTDIETVRDLAEQCARAFHTEALNTPHN